MAGASKIGIHPHRAGPGDCGLRNGAGRSDRGRVARDGRRYPGTGRRRGRFRAAQGACPCDGGGGRGPPRERGAEASPRRRRGPHRRAEPARRAEERRDRGIAVRAEREVRVDAGAGRGAADRRHPGSGQRAEPACRAEGRRNRGTAGRAERIDRSDAGGRADRGGAAGVRRDGAGRDRGAGARIAALRSRGPARQPRVPGRRGRPAPAAARRPLPASPPPCLDRCGGGCSRDRRDGSGRRGGVAHGAGGGRGGSGRRTGRFTGPAARSPGPFRVCRRLGRRRGAEITERGRGEFRTPRGGAHCGDVG